MNRVEYFDKTGYKFTGTEKEFKKIYTRCKKAMPFSDEEKYFDNFQCMCDYAVCDKKCLSHLLKRIKKHGFKFTRHN